MASFSVYAQEESSASVIYTANLDYYVYYEYEVDINNITLPLVVQVPVPPTGTVIGVNGPCMPNVRNWTVSNGYLTITYTHEDQIAEIRRGGYYYIEVGSTDVPAGYSGYAVRLKVE